MKVFFPPWGELKGGLEFARPALCNSALHVKPLSRFATSHQEVEKIHVHLVELLLITDFSPPTGGSGRRPRGVIEEQKLT